MSAAQRASRDGVPYMTSLVPAVLATMRDGLCEQASALDEPEERVAWVEEFFGAAEEWLAKELAATIGDHLGVLAHDMATPISVITVGIEILQSRGPEMTKADRDSVWECIHRNAEQLGSILGQVRTPPRVDARPDVTEVDALVREVVDDGNAVIGAPRIRFEQNGGMALAAVDPDALRRIVNALLSNAVKHGGDGMITVSVGTAEHRIVVRVGDEGPGIPAGHREAVFDRFRRLDPRVPGSGLGLHLARRLARRYGGELTVDPVGGDQVQPRRETGAVLLLELVRTEAPLAHDDERALVGTGTADG